MNEVKIKSVDSSIIIELNKIIYVSIFSAQFLQPKCINNQYKINLDYCCKRKIHLLNTKIVLNPFFVNEIVGNRIESIENPRFKLSTPFLKLKKQIVYFLSKDKLRF